MSDRIFEEREHALETNYFRQQDARLLEALRQRSGLDEIAAALADKLRVQDVDLLKRLRTLGIQAQTAPALFLAPLVQVAWSYQPVTRRARKLVLELARQRGVDAASPSYATLVEWLVRRPPDALFEAAVEVLRYGFSVLPPAERKQRIEGFVDACDEVALATGNRWAALLGIERSASPPAIATAEWIDVQLNKPVTKD